MSMRKKTWSALVLAAGFGTRLLPHTRHTPKPLFTIDSRPLLDIIITRLAEAGCSDVVVNTHYMSQKITSFLESRRYGINVKTSHEPKILGTGGAIRNNIDLLGESPFMVINSDIYTNIDLQAVYRFHTDNDAPVTMVMHDRQPFNTVWVDRENLVTGFNEVSGARSHCGKLMAFTGIHVIDPGVTRQMPPEGTFFSVIDFYAALIKNGGRIKAMIVSGHEWDDIGTYESYRNTAFRETVRSAIKKAFGMAHSFKVEQLHPDGSDTRWSRIICSAGSLVACERGIQEPGKKTEAIAFTSIGRHLRSRKVNVPFIYGSDTFAGISVMDDLGSMSLQHAVKKAKTPGDIHKLYIPVLENLAVLSTRGIEGFDHEWAFQTEQYDKNVIIEQECRYFVRYFLLDFLGMDIVEDGLEREFETLAELTTSLAIEGLIHRDMQSRNVMLKDGIPFFIDFQGARTGPIQYDIASLMIDPYVNLERAVQEQLVSAYIKIISRYRKIDEELFMAGYACCAVARNLQILGAFGHLTVKKEKSWFAGYIPSAAKNLVGRIVELEESSGKKFPALTHTASMANESIISASSRGAGPV